MKSLLILYLHSCFWSCHTTLTLISQVSQLTSIIFPSSSSGNTSSSTNNVIITQSFYAFPTNATTQSISTSQTNANFNPSASSNNNNDVSFGSDKVEENTAISESTKVSGEKFHRRKRNIGQLAFLIHFHTNYNWKRLLNYGNWCGLGGNRAGDNSVVDKCDLCCKQHDFCYHIVKQIATSRNSPLNFFPSAVIGGFGFGLSFDRCNPYGDFYHFDSAIDPFFGGRVPHCLDQYGSCARRVCTCDVEFVKCLRKSTCPGVF